MLQQHHPLIDRDAVASPGATPLTLRVAQDTARFSLRIAPTQLAAASAAFGLELPPRIGAAAAYGDKLAICLGPDEWYLTAPLAEQEALERRFAELYASVLHSLVDIGHREVGIAVEGPKAVLALQSAIAFDVAAMPLASGCRTLFDKAQIVLVRTAEEQFRIEVWRSFSEHVWGLLQAAAREIQLDI